MDSLLRNVFAESNVEYYSVISYHDCRRINEDIIKREDFEPRSVVVFLVPYYSGETVNISRYCASLDYHIVLGEIGSRVIGALKEALPTCRARAYGDHSPIDEVNAALVTGLGMIGDNGLLINEKYGSYVFIGDVVTDIPPELLGALTPTQPRRCEGCGACRLACPTGILRGESELCLSAITQKKGELTEYERELIIRHNTAWGCDLCQSACPHNASARMTPIPFFYQDRISVLTKELLDGMDNGELKHRAFAWRGRKTVQRNLDILEGEYTEGR